MSASSRRRADEVHAPPVRADPRAPKRTCARAWSRLHQPDARWSASSKRRAAITDDLLLSYREQFNIGRRSLLDVLDAQNTRYNVQAQAETARLAKLYAQYRVLAATNRLIECLGVADAGRGAAATSARASTSIRSRRPTCRRTACRYPAMGPPAPVGGTPAGATPGETIGPDERAVGPVRE